MLGNQLQTGKNIDSIVLLYVVLIVLWSCVYTQVFLLKIKNELYRKRTFWLSKKWFDDKPNFYFWKTIYRNNYRFNQAKGLTSILLHTIPSFITNFVYAVFVIIIFESFNYLFPISFKFDSQAIDSLLTAIASIAGVFLGLYFTAISSIAGNLLVRATQDVRRFFTLGPRTEQYVRTVALTGIISIIYLVAKSFGHNIHPFGLIFLAIAASYIIMRFWQISSDVFNSLEPSYSLPWITKEIADSIKRITPPGLHWNKSFIQNHERSLVSYNLELTKNLISFGIKEIKLSENQLLTALGYLGGILIFYAENKNKIPTNSFWYKTKNQFESWVLADSSQIAIALNTGTPISPKIIKDYIWFEEESLDIAVSILKYLIVENKTGSIFQGHEVFIEVAESYGKDFDEQSIKLLFNKLDKISNSVYLIKNDQQHIQKEKLAFVDSQGRLAIAAILGLIKFFDKQTCNDVIKMISNIRWTKNKSDIYKTKLPVAILPRLESIYKDLTNEKIIEGKILSPEWYIQTLCIQQYLFSLQKYFNYLKSLHIDYFNFKFEKLLAEDQLILSAQLIQRWIEFSNKYTKLVYMLKKHIEDCNKFHQVIDLPWSKFDTDKEIEEALLREKMVINNLVILLPKLKDLEDVEDLPDYFGQALTSGVEACYEACRDNDPERLKKIFPAVFDASLSAYEKTLKKVANWSEEESKIIFSTEPLINLFEISGYGKLYSELYQNPELWIITKKLWDFYLTTIDGKQIIKAISAIVNYRANIFKIMPQATLRANWEISFGHKMREQGLPVFPDDRGYGEHNKRPNHTSPLIRILVRWGGLSAFSSQNVFLVTYLSTHKDAEGIDFPDRHDLKEQIEKETKTPTDVNNEEDE